MALAQLTQAQKKQFVQDVGADLVETHGKRKYYSQSEIKAAAIRTGASVDWLCWSYAFFMSEPDFLAYHESIGEVCDYGMMRSAMAEALTVDVGTWFDFDLSWLDWPADILGGVFDFW